MRNSWFPACRASASTVFRKRAAGLPDDLPVLAVTKGMVDGDDGTLIPYPVYYRRKLGARKLNLNAVGGPCTSYEWPTATRPTSPILRRGHRDLKRIKALFGTDNYHISLRPTSSASSARSQ